MPPLSKLSLRTKISHLCLFDEFREATRPDHLQSNPTLPVPALPGTAKTGAVVSVKSLTFCRRPLSPAPSRCGNICLRLQPTAEIAARAPRGRFQGGLALGRVFLPGRARIAFSGLL